MCLAMGYFSCLFLALEIVAFPVDWALTTILCDPVVSNDHPKTWNKVWLKQDQNTLKVENNSFYSQTTKTCPQFQGKSLLSNNNRTDNTQWEEWNSNYASI